MTAAGLAARRLALPVAILPAGALIVFGLGGQGGFATHPVGVLALVAAVALTRGALSASLLTYLVSALLAVVTEHPVAVALWNAMWLVPLALSQVTASAAVRRRRCWEHGLVLGTTAAAFMVTLFLVAPDDPFAGVPQIAPEAWLVSLAPIGDVVSIVGLLALLVLPIRLGRAALTSTGPARAQLGVAAAGTLCAPLTVVFCLLLAVARNPGAVDPATGSVAFLVALSGCAAVASTCALLASRSVAVGSLLRVVRTVLVAVAVLVVAGVGTLLTAPATGLGPTAAALAVAGLALLVVGGAWALAGRVAAMLEPEPEAPGPPPPRVVPGLTRRENEVLELLASGASNAGIAARLVVSERTVDAHLRSVFGKLELARGPETNRRVQAARRWLDQH